MKGVLVYLCFLTSNAVLAQPATGTTYAESKRQADERAYNEAYLQAARQNWNKTSATATDGTHTSEMVQWLQGRQEARKARLEQIRKAEAAERSARDTEQERMDAIYEEQMRLVARIKREMEAKSAEEKAWWNTVLPQVKTVQETSRLSFTDAYSILVRTIPMQDGSYYTGGDSLRPYLRRLPELARKADSLSRFLPYRQIRPLLLELASPNSRIPTTSDQEVGAPATATRILQRYLIKAPADTALCRDALILCRLFFTYPLNMNLSSEEDRLLMVDLYTQAAPFHPEWALYAAADVGYSTWKSPYFLKTYGVGFPGESYTLLLRLAIANLKLRQERRQSWEYLTSEDLTYFLNLYATKIRDYEKGEFIFTGTTYKVKE